MGLHCAGKMNSFQCCSGWYTKQKPRFHESHKNWICRNVSRRSL